MGNLVLIHGFASSTQDWNEVAPILEAGGFHLYATDMLGHGEGPKPEQAQAYTMEHAYTLLVDWIDSLGLEEPPGLVAYSLGGYLSLLYCLRRPERVRNQVLIDPMYRNRQLNPVLDFFVQRPKLGAAAIGAVPKWLARIGLSIDPPSLVRMPEKALEQSAEDFERMSPKAVYLAHDLPDLTPRLPEIHTPTLVIWGGKDELLRPKSFEQLVSALPEGQGRVIKGMGHQPHKFKPEKVGKAILEFEADGQKPDRSSRLY